MSSKDYLTAEGSERVTVDYPDDDGQSFVVMTRHERGPRGRWVFVESVAVLAETWEKIVRDGVAHLRRGAPR